MTPTLLGSFGEIDITPAPGAEGNTRAHDAGIREIAGRLRSRVALFSDGHATLCWFSTDTFHERSFANAVRYPTARALGIPVERVLVSATHNHSIAASGGVRDYQIPLEELPGSDAEDGEERAARRNASTAATAARMVDLARDVARRLEPITLAGGWARAEGLTYNRKGRRPDGSTYFMRESDRLAGGVSSGVIDPDFPLLVARNRAGRVVGFLTLVTGHPVVAFDPHAPRIHPDVTGVALEVLAERLDGAVGLCLQGSAGDVNFREMFGGVARAEAMGRELGETLARALEHLTPFGSDAVGGAWTSLALPLAELPPVAALERDLAELDDFCARAEAGDERTTRLLGYNFSPELEPRYRARLAAPLADWTRWALDTRRAGRPTPRTAAHPLYAFRLGDAALVACGLELFVGIGLEIKRRSPAAFTMTTGYANRMCGYLGQTGDVGDGEYMSSFYRYTRFWPPYAPPAGDHVVERASALVAGLWPEVSAP